MIKKLIKTIVKTKANYIKILSHFAFASEEREVRKNGHFKYIGEVKRQC